MTRAKTTDIAEINKLLTGTIYYHVADPNWRPGEDLCCYDELVRRGAPSTWKWGEEYCNLFPGTFDTDVVCLFETLDEAETFRAEWGGRILRVCVPSSVELVRVSEGYPAIEHVPFEWIEPMD